SRGCARGRGDCARWPRAAGPRRARRRRSGRGRCGDDGLRCDGRGRRWWWSRACGSIRPRFERAGRERRPRMGYKPVVGWGTLPDGWSFVEATAVAVDADDDVWVFNRGAHPVIVFDRGGAFKRSWGEGLIRRAHGITIGPDGTIWLTDDLHHTARQFTAAGK